MYRCIYYSPQSAEKVVFAGIYSPLWIMDGTADLLFAYTHIHTRHLWHTRLVRLTWASQCVGTSTGMLLVSRTVIQRLAIHLRNFHPGPSLIPDKHHYTHMYRLSSNSSAFSRYHSAWWAYSMFKLMSDKSHPPPHPPHYLLCGHRCRTRR